MEMRGASINLNLGYDFVYWLFYGLQGIHSWWYDGQYKTIKIRIKMFRNWYSMWTWKTVSSKICLWRFS